jgi:hypothetical protein
MNFGRYFIGQDFSEIAENAEEVSFANKAANILEYEDEREYHVDDASFCNTRWGALVRVSQGKVFSISLQTSDPYLTYPMTGDILCDIIIKHLNDKLSRFEFEKSFDKFSLTLWYASWGNVTLIKSYLNHKNSDSFEDYTITVTGGLPGDDVKRNKREPYLNLLLGLNDFSAS